ncbi:MAG: hypothetical protein AAGU19_21815 [Prolixibacteraceae bacterium]
MISSSKEEKTGLFGEGSEEEDNGDVSYSPPDMIVSNILNFSKSYEAVKTVSSGFIELNLN